MATIDLSKYGITGTTEIIRNPSYEFLFEEETKTGLEGYDRGQVTDLGAVNVMTGIYTGRSPKDKYIVVDDNSKDTVWWTSEAYKNDNHPMTEETWKAVKDLAVSELCNKRLFVVDAFCGANKDTRMAVRFIVEVAWQAHFVTNMFIRPTAEELENFEPDFVVYNASKAKVENYKELGLNSETAVLFNITSKEQVIVNTWYGGEMKKGMFSMMNYFLPLKGMASMHCSANTDLNGKNTAIFFGLSGTGKTTLSTDPKRLLIGDDEHGWDDNGVFNFEGGCYAKVINLDKDSEPDIYNAIKRNALLENVTVDENGHCDFADDSVTENTRVSYPIDHIEKMRIVDIDFFLDTFLCSLHCIGEGKDFLFVTVVNTAEFLTGTDWPVDRTGCNTKLFFDLIQKIKSIVGISVHLIDKCKYRNVSHNTDLEKLTGLCLNTLGSIDDHNC